LTEGDPDLKIYISTPGDPAAGIDGEQIEIEWNISEADLLARCSTDPREDRETRRRNAKLYLSRMFSELLDDRPSVLFDSDLARMAEQDAERW
jgi:hypothetical protein